MQYFKQQLNIFKNPKFSLQILSCLFATLAMGITYLAMSWIAISHWQNVAAIGLLMTCFWLPGVIAAPFIGVIVDKYNHKNIIIINNILRIIALFLCAAVFFIKPHPLAIYLLAFTVGLAYAFYAPTVLAFVRQIVNPDQLLQANATLNMSYEAGFLIGLTFGGGLMLLLPTALIFVVSAIFLILATICTSLIQFIHTPSSSNAKNTFYQDICMGMNYLFNNRSLLLLYTIQLLLFSLMMTAYVLLVPFANMILEASSLEFAFIEATSSLGIVLGSLVLPFLASKWTTKISLLLSTSGMFICLLIFSLFSNTVPQAIILYGVIGFCFAGWSVITTAAQQATDPQFQGRMQTAFNSIGYIVIIIMYSIVSLTGYYVSIRESYYALILLAAFAFLAVCFSSFKSRKA